MDDQTLQNDTNRKPVPAVYEKIFKMRLVGLTSDEISKATGYSDQHIRRLFAKGGRLHELFREWAQNQQAENIERALDMMAGSLPDMVQADITLGSNPFGGMVASLSRERIIQYVLGKPKEKVELGGILGVAIGSVGEFVRSVYEERAKQQDKTNQGVANRPDQVLP